MEARILCGLPENGARKNDLRGSMLCRTAVLFFLADCGFSVVSAAPRWQKVEWKGNVLWRVVFVLGFFWEAGECDRWSGDGRSCFVWDLQFFLGFVFYLIRVLMN